MQRNPGELRRFFGFQRSRIMAALCFVALAALARPAQSQSKELDPRVEQLYGEAKAAEAQGDPAGAVAKYEELIHIAPTLGAAYNNLGELYVRQREFEKAAEILEKGLKVDPKMPSALALLGISLYEMGDYTRARPRLEAALRANPKDSNVELMLAQDLINLGEPEAGASHLQQIVHREPKNQEAWYQLGKIYMRLSQDALGKMQDIDPNSMRVHEVSGEIMEGMNNFDGAILQFKKAVEMAPNEPGTHYKLGEAYWSISQWDAATEQFKAELENDPRSCLAHAKIGDIILQQHGDAEQSLAEENKALELCANLMEAHSNRGRALLRLSRPEEAMPDLQAAAHASPDDPTVHYMLAQAYKATGHTEEARTEMELFSKLEESARAATAERAQQVMQGAQKPQPPQQPQQ
jgi:tetratricopeptide (TPR) repeat protein